MDDITLPTKSSLPYTVTQKYYEELQRDYPQINVLHNLKMMRNWLEVNPKKRKSNTTRFIINWLNRAKPSVGTSMPLGASRLQAVRENRETPVATPEQWEKGDIEMSKTLRMLKAMKVANDLEP